ncbi:MAG TPA: winged helix-turn-helix domain-containing protein [Steroidobacteraceae bacterium]|jgi:DNA-binding winged helix-turn-helix (wHTH) protein/tetratricopeptide (TPR) repeat protein
MTPTPTESNPSPTQIAFDGWTLDLLTGDLCKNGIRQRLQEQPLQVMHELLARPGELVTREELVARLWPKGVIDFDTGLNTAVRKLRLALGDDPNEPRYIETLPRKGYRFVGKLDPPQAPPHEAEVASSVPQGTGSHDRRARRRAFWLAAIAILLCAGALLTAHFVRSPDSPTGTSQLAFQLYQAAAARQPEISVIEGREARERVLDLLGRALAIDPSLAPAYVVRARTNLDFFISNLDVSDELLAAVRKDLGTARQLSGNDRIGLDVRVLYAALVDLDPEKGLRMTDQAPNDPEVLQSRAIVLMTMGRYRESDEIFDRFLALDPASLRLLTIKITNLLAEGRGREALESIATVRKLSPPWRNPGPSTYPFTGEADFAMPSLSQMRNSLTAAQPDGEPLLALAPELTQMRIGHRFDEIQALLDAVRADSTRVPVFTGALPGLGQHPVAMLRGWNDLLRGDTATAADNGRNVLDFVSRQRVTKWNKWHLRMLEAEAQLFLGNRTEAAVAAVDALNSPPQLSNRHVQAYRAWLAAITLAWAGDHDRSVALLETLSSGAPSLGPASIGRDPLVTIPLKGNARFEILRTALETQIKVNTAR